ncbi:hypothetical protein [Thermocrinis sp.]|uniref:hypothetical protein n=1 Tax=Thermocrinis sp. TaxID=2024383 RepID=UPI003C047038
MALKRGHWPPPQFPIVACAPSRPQRPPQRPPQNPPPPQINYYREDYDLLIPPVLAFNMNVYGMVDYPTGDSGYTKILPSDPSLMLDWQSFPMYDACPEVFATNTNQHIYTDLKSLKNLFSTCRSRVVFPWRDISIKFHRYDEDWEGNIIILDIVLYVFQFVFFSQSWLVAVRKIEIPPLPPGPNTPEYLRNKLNNRRESLHLFYDSEINGFGTVFTNIGGYGASVYPSHAVLYRGSQIAYTLTPASGAAYFMLTIRTQ